jgi:hypothetical protein
VVAGTESSADSLDVDKRLSDASPEASPSEPRPPQVAPIMFSVTTEELLKVSQNLSHGETRISAEQQHNTDEEEELNQLVALHDRKKQVGVYCVYTSPCCHCLHMELNLIGNFIFFFPHFFNVLVIVSSCIYERNHMLFKTRSCFNNTKISFGHS